MVKALLQNPIFVKESVLRKRRIREKWYKGLMDYAIFPSIVFVPVVVGFISLAADGRFAQPSAALLNDIHDMMGGIFFFVSYVLTLYVCYRAATLTYGAIVTEREKKTFESLRGTLMSTREILAGKLLASLYPLLVEIGLFGPALFIFCLGRSLDKCTSHLFIGPLEVAGFVLSLTFFTLFFGLVGLFASVTSPSTMRANHKATSILAAFLILSPILDGLIMGLRCGAGAYERAPFLVSTIVNPLYINTAIVYKDMGSSLDRLGILAGALLFFSLSSWLLYRRIVRRFDEPSKQ